MEDSEGRSPFAAALTFFLTLPWPAHSIGLASEHFPGITAAHHGAC